MKFAVKGFALVVAMALAVPATVHGDVVISTLSNPEEGTDFGVTNTNAAMQFTTGSQAENLTSVTLDLLAGNGTSGGPYAVSLLYNTPLYNPGTLALSMGSITTSGSSYGDYTLNAPSAFTLQANTTYWVALAYGYEANTTPGPWAYTNANPPGYNVSGSGTTDYFAISADGGATWAVGANATYGPYMFQVDAATVPEPSALVVTSIVLLCGMGVKICKRRKQKADATA
jgi:hypothetical protein